MTARTTLLSVLLLGASWVVAQNTAPGSTSPSGSTSSQGTSSTQTSSPNQTDTNANQGSYGQAQPARTLQAGQPRAPAARPAPRLAAAPTNRSARTRAPLLWAT